MWWLAVGLRSVGRAPRARVLRPLRRPHPLGGSPCPHRACCGLLSVVGVLTAIVLQLISGGKLTHATHGRRLCMNSHTMALTPRALLLQDPMSVSPLPFQVRGVGGQPRRASAGSLCYCADARPDTPDAAAPAAAAIVVVIVFVGYSLIVPNALRQRRIMTAGCDVEPVKHPLVMHTWALQTTALSIRCTHAQGSNTAKHASS